MKISDCCGDTGTRRFYYPDVQYKDVGICGKCGEHCEYVEEANRFVLLDLAGNIEDEKELTESEAKKLNDELWEKDRFLKWVKK